MTQWLRMFTTKPDNQSVVSSICVHQRSIALHICQSTYLFIYLCVHSFIHLFLMYECFLYVHVHHICTTYVPYFLSDQERVLDFQHPE